MKFPAGLVFPTATFISLSIIVLFLLHEYRNSQLPILSFFSNTEDEVQAVNNGSLPWTHIVWQSSKLCAEDQSDQNRTLTRSWAQMNPLYRHEMMTHERTLGYINDKLHSTFPELERLYSATKDYMMRTDVLRYLVLWTDGGVYNDLDVECLEPIDTWIPEPFREKAGVVLGVEHDYHTAKEGHVFSLVVWTMVAKPKQPFIRFVLDRLQENMTNLTAQDQQTLNTTELMSVTGPAATTASFLEYASIITKSNVSPRNFTHMTRPRLVGEVLILPLWAFGSSYQVRKAKLKEQAGTALVKHHFAGTWKADHGEIG